MKKLVIGKNGISLGVLACAAFVASPASAELVYESDIPQGQASASSLQEVQPGAASRQETGSREEERALTRKTLKVAESSIESDGTYPAMTPDAPAVQSRSSAPTTEDAVEVTSVSRSELLRRQRMRKELQNEDALQERLEGLRLQNEMGIADRILGSKDVQGVSAASSTKSEEAAAAESATMEQEVVSSSIIPATSNAAAPVAEPVAPVSQASPAILSSVSSGVEASVESESVRLAISPRLGMSSMANSYGYVIAPRYTAGIDVGVAVSDHVRFDVGYAFSEYGVSLATSNPWVWGFQNYTGTREPLAMKQNVVDAGLRLFVLGEDSRLRPYLGGGGAYAKSFINYDQRIINALWSSGLQSLASDYTLDSFLGYVTGGLDVRLTKSVSVGANARYYAVLSSRENQSLNNAAISGYYPGYYGYGTYYSADADKQILGGTMSRAAFYSVTGEVTFTF